MTLQQWEKKAQKRLTEVIAVARRRSALRQVLSAKEWQADVHLVSGPKMRELNHQYRGKDQPTDVLSFEPPAVVRQHGYLGELVICRVVLSRQAKTQKHSEAIELDVLLVHGLLHLLGWDHERSEREARDMATWETKLLQALGRKRVQSGLIGRF